MLTRKIAGPLAGLTALSLTAAYNGVGPFKLPTTLFGPASTAPVDQNAGQTVGYKLACETKQLVDDDAIKKLPLKVTVLFTDKPTGCNLAIVADRDTGKPVHTFRIPETLIPKKGVYADNTPVRRNWNTTITNTACLNSGGTAMVTPFDGCIATEAYVSVTHGKLDGVIAIHPPLPEFPSLSNGCVQLVNPDYGNFKTLLEQQPKGAAGTPVTITWL
jgi:hypothetical protein